MMENLPRYKKMDVSEPVSVTLPAYVWMGFVAAYAAAEWAEYNANAIGIAAQEQLLHPAYVKEQDARAQQHRDQHKSIFDTILTGKPPEVPPNMEDNSLALLTITTR